MAKTEPGDEAVPRPEMHCSFCRKHLQKTGPLVEGKGPSGTGGVFICRECAAMALSIIGIEDHRLEGQRRRKDANAKR
jgi:ClpX C4-type zinc finger